MPPQTPQEQMDQRTRAREVYDKGLNIVNWFGHKSRSSSSSWDDYGPWYVEYQAKDPELHIQKVTYATREGATIEITQGKPHTPGSKTVFKAVLRPPRGYEANKCCSYSACPENTKPIFEVEIFIPGDWQAKVDALQAQSERAKKKEHEDSLRDHAAVQAGKEAERRISDRQMRRINRL